MVSPYPSLILKHARSQAFKGTLTESLSAHAVNRPCGDWVRIHIREVDGRAELRFEGEGCALALGTASACCEAFTGLSLKELEAHAAVLLAAFDGPAFDSESAAALVTPQEDGALHPLAELHSLCELKARRGCVSLSSRVIVAALRNPSPGGPDESGGSVQR